MKECNRCHEIKPLTCFHKNKGTLDGRRNKCKPCCAVELKKWRSRNPECRKDEHARRHARKGGLTREARKKQNATTNIGRKASTNKYTHKRRLQLLQRSSGNTELDEFVIEEALKLAELRFEASGLKWSVDHIIPLNHKTISGLHVAINLQVVPSNWNSSKGNRNTTELIFGLPQLPVSAPYA